MKKLLLLVLLTSMFGTAHATRTRMNSLGQDTNQGSFYLMDNRNFFRNPANAAKMRNFMVAELATSTAAGNVEGGYFGEFNSDMAFGVYLGKTNIAIDVAANASATLTFLDSTDANPLNLFLGGGADMKWGVNLGFAMTDKEITGGKQTYDSLGLAVGIETSGGLQVYASYSSAETDGGDTGATTTAFTSGKIESAPMTIGLIYNMNAETTLFGQYSGGSVETTMSSNPKTESDFSNYVLGVGRIYELSPTARFNFDLSYNWSEVDISASGKLKDSSLPLVIGLEADAAEWLILRASVRQNFILGESENTVTGLSDKTGLPGTTVAIGGTLHFGKLKIDGNLGTNNTDLLDSQEFFGNAAATYMF